MIMIIFSFIFSICLFGGNYEGGLQDVIPSLLSPPPPLKYIISLWRLIDGTKYILYISEGMGIPSPSTLRVVNQPDMLFTCEVMGTPSETRRTTPVWRVGAEMQ
jgi:hypothetical protein